MTDAAFYFDAAMFVTAAIVLSSGFYVIKSFSLFSYGFHVASDCLKYYDRVCQAKDLRIYLTKVL